MSAARPFRLTAFRLGLMAGVAVPVLTMLGVKAWLGLELFRPKFNVEVISKGADVSRHRGAKVIVSDAHRVVTEQICQDGCDDFQLQGASADNEISVSILDGKGRALAFAPPTYVTNSYGAAITRWTISGQDDLSVRTSFIDRNRDGSFKETLFRVQSTSGPPLQD